jgi:hypothetical protein
VDYTSRCADYWPGGGTTLIAVRDPAISEASSSDDDAGVGVGD